MSHFCVILIMRNICPQASHIRYDMFILISLSHPHDILNVTDEIVMMNRNHQRELQQIP